MIEIPWGLIALAIVLEVVVLAATGKAKMDLSMGVLYYYNLMFSHVTKFAQKKIKRNQKNQKKNILGE